MLIRRLHAEDAKDFRALRLEGLERHPEAFGASYEDELAQPLARSTERLAAGLVFGAFDTPGILRGVIGLRSETAPKMRHIAEIWGMYVTPDSRRCGFAAALLHRAIAEARGSCRSLRLSVAANNRAAQRLYEGAGFAVWAVDREALYVQGTYRDEILMRLDFG